MADNKKKTSVRKRTAGKQTTGGAGKVKDSIGSDSYREEIILVVTLVASLLIILSYFNLGGVFGTAVNFVLFGLFGFAAYLVPVLLFFGVAFALSNQGLLSARIKLISSVFLYMVMTGFMDLILGGTEEQKFAAIFIESSKERSGGGVIGGALSKGLGFVFGEAGTYIVYIGLAAILLMLITEKLLFAGLREQRNKSVKRREERRAESVYESSGDETDTTKRPAKIFTFSREDKENILRAGEAGSRKKTRAEAKQAARGSLIHNKAADSKSADMEAAVSSVITDEEAVNTGLSDLESLSIMRGYEKKETESMDTAPIYEKELQQKFGSPNSDEAGQADTLTGGSADDIPEETAPAVTAQETVKERPASKAPVKAPSEAENKQVSDEIGQALRQKKKDYVFPTLDLLNQPKKNGKSTSDQELRDTAAKLKSTLESFGVKVEMKNVSCGPAVTRYELQPAQGVKVSRITSLADDIKLSLAAADIRIEAPIPGKSAVGIEVPNREVSMVYLRSLLESSEFKSHKSNIAFAVGKDIGGNTIVTDIAKMPHLLIAGATGSGKSVCINTLIMSILYKANPEDVKLIMVDPKVVELSVYNGIPHLLIPVVTEPKKASGALNWAVMEMTERYKKFADLGVRDIKGYNARVEVVENDNDERFQKMPQIVIIVDELADLMMVAPGEVEDAICRLAQLARAAGIHLIIATQRPSVNVITGLIKANVPSRVAFAVSSAIDSRTILDGGGAEKLLGNGDMLFFPSGYPKPVRVQGSYVSDKEVSAVVDFLKEEYGKTEYSEEIDRKISTSTISDSGQADSANERDEYFAEAGRFIIEKDKASIGMLQRVYKIGFNRAARIMDQLYDAGVVGPEEGTKPRKVIMSPEEFEQYMEEY